MKDCSCCIEYFLKRNGDAIISMYEYIYLGKLAVSTQALVEFYPVV